MLRPPTFEALGEAVKRAADAGEPFHVVHFDGHGAMRRRPAGGRAAEGSPAVTGPGEGVLAFEKPGGGSDLVGASRVAAALAGGRVPVVVLNACQSGAVGKELEASVATALLGAGCAAVVAMAYSVYAVAAAEFMAQFYESLFAADSVGQAVMAGRMRLFRHDGRPSARGEIPLADWLVPVHYMRQEVRFPQARTSRPAAALSLDAALDQIRAAPSGAASQNPLTAVDGVFVGRDDLFYELEVAARLQRVVVLAGPGGTGKTELAKGFARWWRDTEGVDDPRLVLWHPFEPGGASFGLDGVITRIGLDIFRAPFARLDPLRRLGTVKQLLARNRALLVWDNFESVREMPDPARATPPLDEVGCAALKGFLEWVRDHSASTVIITSRTQEDWLGQVSRIAVGGLDRAEAAQYADYLMASFPAARVRRDQRSFGELLEGLDGHPLAMRLTLPRLDTTSPGDLLAGLRGTTLLPTGDGGQGRLSSLEACIAYSFAHLSEQARRLLPAVSLFHGIADEGVLTIFSTVEGVPGRFAGVSKPEWTAVFQDAVRVGLLTGLGGDMYQVHPALPGYLAAGWRAANPSGYGQERAAGEQALRATCASFSLLLIGQITSGNAASAYAIIGLQRRTLGAMLGHALDHHAWHDADNIVMALNAYWDIQGLGEEADAWSHRILAATTGNGQPPPEPARSLWLNTASAQAARQLAAGQPDQARQAYVQLLTYLVNQPETDEALGSISTIQHQLGMAAQARGRLDEAEDWYRRSLTINERLGNHPPMALTYHQLGITAYLRARLDEAEAWCRKSLSMAEDLDDRPHMASNYHQLGLIAQKRGRLDEAKAWYRKSRIIEEGLGNRAGMAHTYAQLGTTAYLSEELGEAEAWFRKSLTIMEELGNRPDMAGIYHQLGIIAQVTGRLDEAEAWFRKSLTIEEELGNLSLIAMTYGRLCMLAQDRQQPRQALAWIIKSVTLLSQLPNPPAGPGPLLVAQLTRQLGMPVLEEIWQQVNGQPVPQEVRDFMTRYHTKSRTRPMTDPAADAAPSPAVTLAPELGPSLPTEVEARCPDAQHRPDRYLEMPRCPSSPDRSHRHDLEDPAPQVDLVSLVHQPGGARWCKRVVPGVEPLERDRIDQHLWQLVIAVLYLRPPRRREVLRKQADELTLPG